MNDIIIIGGGKGGVGKSMVSIGVIDMVRARGEAPLLIESDTSNPDVWKMYEKEMRAEPIDLDDANGWIDFINACDGYRDGPVIVNTAARNNRGVTDHAATLQAALDELARRVVTLWVINRQRDSLELLGEYMRDMPASQIHVVRNNYYGEPHKFELYNGSKLRTQVEEKGGKSVDFPDLADRVSDDLYSKRLSVDKAAKQLPLGNRAELTRWRQVVHATLGGVLYD
ncbi:protein mobD [Rugamonas apoptosis]|uniref:Protein mobD n=1 Tax=Rugamonas apoptosis TaxID=2758570 RepID=A0A7W2F8Q8_9BURK|nr:protein mobD [Rugamonas apoptosis]MBA5687223.1 protein mobD [Rugamonas apoptosis]